MVEQGGSEPAKNRGLSHPRHAASPWEHQCFSKPSPSYGKRCFFPSTQALAFFRRRQAEKIKTIGDCNRPNAGPFKLSRILTKGSRLGRAWRLDFGGDRGVNAWYKAQGSRRLGFLAHDRGISQKLRKPRALYPSMLPVYRLQELHLVPKATKVSLDIKGV